MTAGSGLRLRRGVGESNGITCTMPIGEKVSRCGFYTKMLDTSGCW